MKNRPLHMHDILFSLLFLSGFCALVIQVVAIRGFSLVLGNTFYALSCVVSAFMLGLTLGSAYADRLLKKTPAFLFRHNIILYGLLEALVGVYCFFVISRLFRNQDLFIVAETVLSSFMGTMLSHFLISFMLLLIPTVFMGMTFPLLSLSFEDRKDLVKLYAFNTFGAAAGALLSSFLFIRKWGCTKTLFFTGAAGVFIFIVTLAMKKPSAGGRDEQDVSFNMVGEAQPEGKKTFSGLRAILLMSFFSGLVFLSGEIIWARMISLLLGNRIYVTSLSLFIVLLAIGAGAKLGRELLRRFQPVCIIQACYLVSAAGLLLSFLLKDQSLKMIVESGFILNAGVLVRLLPFVFSACVVPSVAMAVVFPVSIAVVPSGIRMRGEFIGSIFAVNTLGSVIGSLATSYFLFHYLGTNAAVSVVVMLLLLCSCVLIFSGPGGLPVKILYAVVLALALPVIYFFGFSRTLYFDKSDIIASGEDEHGVFQIVKYKNDYLRVFNDSTELVFRLGQPLTRQVQEMQAHLPMLFADNAKEILNIGTGYGITAGAFTLYEDLRNIDTVEIVPLMIKHADRFLPYNYRYYDNPKVNVFVTDGRHFLASSGKQYDIVSINVSDPYLPGSASLFSGDFYRAVKKRIPEKGIVCQHVFGPDIISLVHNFHSFFPYLKAVPSYANGITLIGSQKPLVITEERLTAFFDKHSEILKPIGIGSAGRLKDLISQGDRIIQNGLGEKPEFAESDDGPILEFRVIPGKVGMLHSNQ
jgi:spermidine synthase